ncbi:MAG TPA: M20/M25/M40 family metallo-hydrolase [Gemmatimonas sp.]|uniref:M20/M25/M40 family metallo-hydrolase n=1 Tax=Gemmatimonas sp. TaxID=1962908 RepID=UPI002ED9F07F
MLMLPIPVLIGFVMPLPSPTTWEDTATDAGDMAAVASWVSFDAPVGLEMRTTPALASALSRETGGVWQADALGNLMLRRGTGSPKRVVACAIDRPGFAVTQITTDGFLRLHRVGNVAHALWDQAHEGQQIEVLTDRGAVPGVVAIANGHFAQQHRRDSLVATADELWVDVGAQSAADVQALGIALLDPVQRRLPAWTYADRVSGAQAGLRAGCAAVTGAARGEVPRGETMFVVSVQGAFGWPGLGGVLARIPGFVADTITVFLNGRGERQQRWARAGALPSINAGVYRAARADSLRIVSPAVRHAGTLVESITLAESRWLLSEAQRAAGVSTNDAGVFVMVPVRDRARASIATEPHAATARLLTTLADLPGVPTHEWRVRDAVRRALPAWAQSRAQVDDAGNLIVTAGPARDTVVFMAHLDEVAYDITTIARDGTVSLRARGGAIGSAWEGQPALLHLPPTSNGLPDTLAGVFVPRDSARTRQPARMTAWFGIDSAALVARGVVVGAGVTSPKSAVRLSGPRFTGRSMDDRAGSTALLLALGQIDPARLDRTVIFVWSTQEETGLIGAQAVANRIGASVQRMYSIDTFVSSETPLESPHFAFVRLGAGPVLRAIENGSISPPAVRAHVSQVARAQNIPLQTGLTQGGTDGTSFTFFGAPNTGLSWPGRYSHTPAEVLDLRDVERLGSLIAALARARP